MKNFTKIKNKEILFKLFEGEKVSLFPIYLMDLAATSSVKKILGKAVRKIVCFYNKTNVKMCVDKQSWLDVCDYAQKNLIKDEKFYIEVKETMIKKCGEIEKFSDHLLKINPENFTDKNLLKLYADFEKKTLNLRAYAWIPNFVDSGTVSIFDLAEEEIKNQIGNDERIKEYISKFTTPGGKNETKEA